MRHTNLTRRIDPHDPEGLESPKLQESGSQKNMIMLLILGSGALASQAAGPGPVRLAAGVCAP